MIEGRGKDCCPSLGAPVRHSRATLRQLVNPTRYALRVNESKLELSERSETWRRGFQSREEGVESEEAAGARAEDEALKGRDEVREGGSEMVVFFNDERLQLGEGGPKVPAKGLLE